MERNEKRKNEFIVGMIKMEKTIKKQIVIIIIASILLIGIGFISGFYTKVLIEKNKIINRVTDKIDNRTKKVVLNPKCVELFEKRKKELKKLEETATRNISKKEIDEFLNTLEKMIKNLSN